MEEQPSTSSDLLGETGQGQLPIQEQPLALDSSDVLQDAISSTIGLDNLRDLEESLVHTSTPELVGNCLPLATLEGNTSEAVPLEQGDLTSSLISESNLGQGRVKQDPVPKEAPGNSALFFEDQVGEQLDYEAEPLEESLGEEDPLSPKSNLFVELALTEKTFEDPEYAGMLDDDLRLSEEESGEENTPMPESRLSSGGDRNSFPVAKNSPKKKFQQSAAVGEGVPSSGTSPLPSVTPASTKVSKPPTSQTTLEAYNQSCLDLELLLGPVQTRAVVGFLQENPEDWIGVWRAHSKEAGV